MICFAKILMVHIRPIRLLVQLEPTELNVDQRNEPELNSNKS